MLTELSAIAGLATAPGGSNIVFDSAVPSYELVTAYGFVNVSVSPTSRISIGTINGVATNEAEINLALGAVSTVVVGLQSVEYGCPIGAVYTISAEQVAIDLESATSTGVFIPEFESNVTEYVLASTYTSVSLATNTTYSMASCIGKYDGIEVNCSQLASETIPISTNTSELTIEVSIATDVPPIETKYKFELVQAVCEGLGVKISGFKDDLTCLSDNYGLQTVCLSMSTKTSVTFSVSESTYCKATSIQYINGTWNDCTGLQCPFSDAANNYRVVFSNSVNSSEPDIIYTFDIYNGEMCGMLCNVAHF